jgi:hypothetical protein
MDGEPLSAWACAVGSGALRQDQNIRRYLGWQEIAKWVHAEFAKRKK